MIIWLDLPVERCIVAGGIAGPAFPGVSLTREGRMVATSTSTSTTVAAVEPANSLSLCLPVRWRLLVGMRRGAMRRGRSAVLDGVRCLQAA